MLILKQLLAQDEASLYPLDEDIKHFYALRIYVNALDWTGNIAAHDTMLCK